MKEGQFYEKIIAKLGELFTEKAGNVYLERTAYKSFSDTLKSVIPRGHEIIFNFLKVREARPDVTGFIKAKYDSKDFVVVEVKLNTLKLDDIYQIRKYADLFNARFAFLVSLKPIPEEIKRLVINVPQIIQSANWRQTILLARFDFANYQFIEWYPKNPFEENFRWQDYQIA